MTQGGEEYTIEPLSYRNQTVEEFYRYENVQANTATGIERSDVSTLFFYEGPNGLSLGIIHDEPNDGSGGAVTFEFAGLPTDEGSWVLRDDPGDFTDINDSTPDWTWADSKTDGGVFRGGLTSGTQIQLTPRFNDQTVRTPLDPGQITSWQLLSGDASSPNRQELDLTAPVEISIGDRPESGLTAVTDQKLALADEITAISPTINERDRVEPTLESIGQLVENGDVTEAAAVDAVERMKLGENVTEASLAALGPTVAQTPEQPGSLVGVPAGQPAADPEFDVAGDTVENTLFIGVSFLAVGSAFARVASLLGRLGRRLSQATEAVDDALGAIFGAVPFVADRLRDISELLSDELGVQIESEGIEDGARLYDLLAEEIAQYRDPLANDFLGAVESNAPGTSFDDALEEFDDSLADATLEGSQDGAAAAAGTGTDLINDELRETQNSLAVTGFVAGVGDILAVAGALTVALSGGTLAIVGTAAAIVGTFLSISFDFLGAVAGSVGVFDVLGLHNRTLDAAARGVDDV